ncbi:hypothetical protein CcaverHIS641_0405450 [Cutaneotrichosporon cavernicola]|nr:hypothetical protein CcaverHIS641_0405450 [Cutaneotrichosporon cavernicola]
MDTRTTYRVIQELGHHESDVKAVLALKDDALLACASRDGLISLWTKQPHGDESPFGFKTALRGHNAYVNSLAHIPPENTVWDVKIVANDSWQGPFITASDLGVEL